MARLAASASGRCSTVCALPPRHSGDQHRVEQRGRPAAATRRSTFGGLQREAAMGAPISSPQQQTAPQTGQQLAGQLPPAALAAAGFAAVAADVFAPGSLHVLQPLDQWAHAAVAGAQWDPALQRLLAGAWPASGVACSGHGREHRPCASNLASRNRGLLCSMLPFPQLNLDCRLPPLDLQASW